MILAAEGARAAVGLSQVTDWDQIPKGLPLVIASYMLGGILGGIAFWALRPLRRNVLGWALTGFVIGTLAYGSIGLAGILGYYGGVNFLDLTSAHEGWSLLPTASPVLGLLAGVPGGIYFWYRRRTSEHANTWHAGEQEDSRGKSSVVD